MQDVGAKFFTEPMELYWIHYQLDKEKLSDKAGTLPGIALNWPQCGNKGSRTSIWHILQRCKLPKLMQEPHLLPRHMQAHLRFAEDRKYIKHQLEHGKLLLLKPKFVNVTWKVYLLGRKIIESWWSRWLSVLLERFVNKEEVPWFLRLLHQKIRNI